MVFQMQFSWVPFDIWMLHQINKEVSLEERRKIWEEEEGKS